MIEVVSVCVTEGQRELRERLESDLGSLRKEGLSVDIQEKSVGNQGCVSVFLSSTRPEALAFARDTAADAISDTIVNRGSKTLIDRFLKTNYHYFDDDELDIIRGYTEKALFGPSDESRAKYLVNQHSQIRKRVREYIDKNKELIIDGFITFRLKDWVEEVEDALDRAVDEFLLDREYKEFVNLLRSFVDAQEPKVDEIHVFLTATGTFKLMDSQKNVINNEYLEDFVLELVDSEVNHEDLLISALITIAPRKLIIHCPPAVRSGHTIETLRQVFDNRLTVCDSCALCRGGETAFGAGSTRARKSE